MNTDTSPPGRPTGPSSSQAHAAQGPGLTCLAAATPTEVGPPPGRPSAAPPLAAVRAAFPQLEILALLGQGGMGVVYKARQPSLDRFVALKLLPKPLATEPAFAARLHREARTLARLNHPNIVTVHDCGQSGGFFYLLMEYVDGASLRQTLRAGRLGPRQVLALVPQVCDALQFAHDEGVLHRDIKPENILLDTRGRVKVADFGLAKLLGGAEEQSTLTAVGAAVGTPHYMAPEQLDHPQDVDQRADLFSLGVVFYEMLTGELPRGHFAPPSQKCPVDPRVDAVVVRALQPDRERRYRSASEIKRSVEAIAATPPTPSLLSPPATTESGPPRRAPCYFSTPSRMRQCFSAPQARLFQCKGELRLEPDRLTFISPWQTRLGLAFNDIRDVSLGRFEMRTTPWAAEYPRLSFLSVTYGRDDREQTVCLTPVPAGARSVRVVNAEVVAWFEAVQQSVAAVTGVTPPQSAPAAVTIGALRCWRHRVGPLLFLAPLTGWLVGVLNLHSPFGPAPAAPWAAALTLFVLVCTALAWFALGFLRARQALAVGNLDAVSDDDPPEDAVGTAGNDTVPTDAGPRKRPRRPFWWTVVAWAFVAVGLLALIDTLTGLYSRPMRQTLYPGVAQLLVGIAMLTLSRRWRWIALAGLGLALTAGAFITVMLVLAPEHGSVAVPGSTGTVPVTEMPRVAATAAVFLGLFLGGPCYLLLSAKGRALFGLRTPRSPSPPTDPAPGAS